MPQQQDSPFGPFTDILTQPYVAPQSNIQMTGWETGGTKWGDYAMKFMEGMSQSRRRAFEENEPVRRCHRMSIRR